MQQYLRAIIQSKKERLKSLGSDMTLLDALSKKGLSIIGEVKKASPSKGMIKEGFDPVELGKIYDQCVDSISVLTEEDYFLGNMTYLKAINRCTKLPILCKDFIVDARQVYEAKGAGASGILLIVAILSNDALEKLYKLSYQLGMDVIVEVHNYDELKRALKIEPKIIGINNRNLKTFKVSLDTTITLRKYIPNHIVVVSESGILVPSDVKQLVNANIDAILVGEGFMRTHDIKSFAHSLREVFDHESS